MKKIIIANWKMNLGPAASAKLARQYRTRLKKAANEVVVCPSEFALASVGQILKGSRLKLGAQNVFWQANGASTGEVSVSSLLELGCAFTLIGHSEQRALGETCRKVNAKLKVILAAKKLTAVVCVGESWPTRRAGKSQAVVAGQIKRALAGVKKTGGRLLIAYEPIWAIGSGRTVSTEQATQMHGVIKRLLARLAPSDGKRVKVLYGGSVNAANAGGFLALKEVDGLLVGGASLKVDQIKKIANIK